MFNPLTAATYPGSGRLHILANATPDWCDMARVASVCARRLRPALGLRDIWASDVDLCLGKALHQQLSLKHKAYMDRKVGLRMTRVACPLPLPLCPAIRLRLHVH